MYQCPYADEQLQCDHNPLEQSDQRLPFHYLCSSSFEDVVEESWLSEITEIIAGIQEVVWFVEKGGRWVDSRYHSRLCSHPANEQFVLEEFE